MSKMMNQQEFDDFIAKKNNPMLATHWPRAKALLIDQGLTPNQAVEIMNREGYWGRTSNRIDLADLQWMQQAAAEDASKNGA